MVLNNSQYDAIIRTYEQKQLHNRDVSEKRLQTAYNKLPDLKTLHQSISSLSVKQARKLLEGDDNALQELKAQIKDLSEEAKAMLVTGGFPADYLEPVYECADCKDTGYIGNEKCHCFRKAIVDLLYTQSNLKSILEKENFDTFSFSYYSRNHIDPETGVSSLANAEHSYKIAQDFVDTFGNDFRNLLFLGNPGTGKTFLSNCIAKELMDKSYSVVYLSAFDLFDIFAKSKFGNDFTSDQLHEHILDCDLLIIDDLGTELPNSFTVSQLFLCLNERILHRKSTIISSNLSVESLPEIYSQRTFSRMMEHYTILKLTGDDIRIKKNFMNREDN